MKKKIVETLTCTVYNLLTWIGDTISESFPAVNIFELSFCTFLDDFNKTSLFASVELLRNQLKVRKKK